MNQEQNPPNHNSKKMKKKKGPLRWEALVPVTVIFVLFGFYFSIFFDNHLRHLGEFAGTHINGAEVDIADIRTSFWRGTFRLSGLQVTDKDEPSRNTVSIGEIRFGFLWDALLRAKFVVDEASIINIQALSPRRKPGRVLPPPQKGSGKSEALAKLENGLLEQTKKEFNDNLFGDIAHVVEGANPADQIKNIESQLKSSLRLKELETSLKEKQKQWDARLKSLPKTQELKDFETRVKAVKIDTKDPVKFAASLKQIQDLVKEADQKIRTVKEAGDSLNGDFKSVDLAFKELDQLVKQDIQDLEKHLKIPQIDVKDFSKKLFGKMFADKLVTVQKYWAIAQEYMPPKKSAAETKAASDSQLVPRPRGSGKNYRFPVTRGYPLFWLKRASISSEPSQGEYSGKIAGELLDLTSQPAQIGRPTIINFSGDFPRQQLLGLSAKITLDHTTDHPKDTILASLASFPTSEQKFSDSPEVKLLLLEARGKSHFNAVLENQELTVHLNNEFTHLKYAIDAQSKIVKEILTSVTNDIPVITLEARASGNWNNLQLGLRSNLGDELAKGFKKQIQEKINEARAKIKSLIDEKISGEKAKLTAEFEKIKGQLTKELNQANQKIDQAKKDAESQLAGSKNSSPENAAKAKVQDAGKKALDGLKKKFGF